MCPTNVKPHDVSTRHRPRKLPRISETSSECPSSLTKTSCCEVLVCFGDSQEGIVERLWSLLRSSCSSKAHRWPHWAVVLSYGKKYMYCAGRRDSETGDLVGTVTWRTAAQLDAVAVHRISLGRHDIRPEQLHELMTELCQDKEYRKVENDSQTWAMRLLNQLSLDVPE